MTLHAIELAAPNVATKIDAALLADLRQRAPQGRNKPVTLSVTANDCTLVAGICSSASYGWLLIKVLWVAPEMRRQGFGRALVADAFRRAKALGCHNAWLDTSNCDACEFYTALGFGVCGKLHNQEAQVPLDHQRWFLKCPIT